MASKGYVNKETQILADNAAEPHIYDEGGITDVVSDHITDIIADNAHDIFDTDEVKEAVDGTAVLIQTITTDNETLSYVIDNLGYRNIMLKFTTNTASTNAIEVSITFNDKIVIVNPLLSNTTNHKAFAGLFRFADMYIPIYAGPGLYTSPISARLNYGFNTRIRTIDKININLASLDDGVHTIEIWGVK